MRILITNNITGQTMNLALSIMIKNGIVTPLDANALKTTGKIHLKDDTNDYTLTIATK